MANGFHLSAARITCTCLTSAKKISFDFIAFRVDLYCTARGHDNSFNVGLRGHACSGMLAAALR